LSSLPKAERDSFLASLSKAEFDELEFNWPFWGRQNQFAPTGPARNGKPWQNWLILAGRGFGKTRTGAEWVRERVTSKQVGRIALIAETQKDLEDVMVFGDSGIASVFPEHQKPKITRKPIRIEFHTGALAFGYNATEPDQLRGPQFDCAWCDELAKWRYAGDTWDQLQFSLRLGVNPQCLISTTPRAIKLVKDLVADDATIVTHGSTLENTLNLSPQYAKTIMRKYAGTRLGRQEIYAEILDDVPGALWQRAVIDADRVKPWDVPPLIRIVVAIDPAVTSGEDSDETGIIAAGIDANGHGYILEDGSGRYAPHEWAANAIAIYQARGADRIVGEVNNGGDMVEGTIRVVNPNVSYKGVHAHKGKFIRAEPASALYEQHRVHHVGAFGPLEDQMCAFTQDFDRTAGYSPDRMDALVWALTELMLEEAAPKLLFA
jgi:phage terminase large subunit-like protein